MRATSITAAAKKRRLEEIKLKSGDLVYHKEFFWTGELIYIETLVTGSPSEVVRGCIKWDDLDLPQTDMLNLEEVELYDFKGIIQGAIHRERTKSKKN